MPHVNMRHRNIMKETNIFNTVKIFELILQGGVIRYRERVSIRYREMNFFIASKSS